MGEVYRAHDAKRQVGVAAGSRIFDTLDAARNVELHDIADEDRGVVLPLGAVARRAQHHLGDGRSGQRADRHETEIAWILSHESLS